MYFTLAFFLVRLALQDHVFTIGTELMWSVEEEVNFDGLFYTFGGFNVSIFASRLSCSDLNLDCLFEANCWFCPCLIFLYFFLFLSGASGQFPFNSTQRLELWLICASSSCPPKQPWKHIAAWFKHSSVLMKSKCRRSKFTLQAHKSSRPVQLLFFPQLIFSSTL